MDTGVSRQGNTHTHTHTRNAQKCTHTQIHTHTHTWWCISRTSRTVVVNEWPKVAVPVALHEEVDIAKRHVQAIIVYDWNELA